MREKDRPAHRASRGMAAAALLLLGALLILAGCGSSKGEAKETASKGGSGTGGTIRVGVLDAQSGPCQPYEAATTNGIELAAEKLNKDGVSIGGKSYHIGLKVINTKGENTVGITEVRGALNEGIKYFLNPNCSAASMPGVAALFARSGVIAINNYGGPGLNAKTTAETVANVKGEWKNVFSDTLPTEAQGIRDSYSMEIFPNWKQSVKRVYILMQNEAGALVIAHGFAKGLQKQGIESESAFYSPSTTDFSGFLARVKAYKPDVLVSGYLPTPSLAVLKQALSVKAAPRYYGYGEPLEDALKTAVGGPITIPAVWDFYPVALEYDKRPPVQELARQVKTKEGKFGPLSGTTGDTYDDLPMLIEAMKKAGTADEPNAIARALETVTYSGIFENSHFDDTHHLETSTDGCLLENGKISDCHTQTIHGLGPRVGP